MQSRHRRIEEIKEVCKTELSERGLQNGLPDGEPPPGVREAVDCIHGHLYDPRLTVRWMQERCRLNGHHFAGRFKHYMGKTPKRYWLHHRLQTAKLMLRDEALSDASIVDIALSVGFNSHSSFTTTFKKYVGCTPGEYRDGKN